MGQNTCRAVLIWFAFWACCLQEADADNARSRSIPLSPELLNSREACALARRDRISGRTVYSIPGTYRSDGMHGSGLEVTECNQAIFPTMEGDASLAIARYHDAFAEKCGGPLMGDIVSGVFTGRFMRRRAQLFGMSHPMMINFFVVSAIETNDLNAASITCPR